MKRKQTQVLLIALTVLALGAGLTAGLLAARLDDANHAGAARKLPAPVAERAGLADELGLSEAQREQIRSIWEGVRDQVRDTFQAAQELERARDQAMIALLTDEQKAQFEKISQDFSAQYSELALRREQSFTDAVEQTRKLLNDEQRTKYERILQSRGAPVRGSATTPTGQPARQ